MKGGQSGCAKETKSPEEVFEKELDEFRKEAEAGVQFLYSYYSVHNEAIKRTAVRKLLNEAPLFWNTCLGALHQGVFIALGRIFDQTSPHNIDALIRQAQRNPQIFSKAALAQRARRRGVNVPEQLDYFLRDVYEPTPKDFRLLRRHVARWRKIYEKNYGDIRDKLYAHKELSDHAEIEEVFKRSNDKELQRMLVLLVMLHNALWYLFANGDRPVFRRQRRSFELMRDKPLSRGLVKPVQEIIVSEVRGFFLKAVNYDHPLQDV